MTLEFSSLELGRLAREDQWDATDLAQELQALLPEFVRDIPAARLVARATDEFPSPIDITDFTTNGDAPFATFRRGSDTFTVNIGPNGITTEASPSAVAAGSNAMPGQIVSYVGANVYNVATYPNGTTGGSRVVSVLQLEGDPAVPHAAGRWAMVTKCGSQYSMNIPTWG